MSWFTAVVLYVLIWWTMLFAILPLGTIPASGADPVSGWQGAPTRPNLGKKLLQTTLATFVVWLAAMALIGSDWLSFRHGILAMPTNYS